MKAKLIVVGGTTSTAEVDLRLPTIIGRGRSVQVTIPHSLVSRQHCEILEAEGRLLVRDLDSMNGTYIGDERIAEAILEPGALLTVGTVTFRAVYEIGGEGELQLDDTSQQDDSDDTCCVAPSTCEPGNAPGAEQEPSPDFETVPISATSSSAAPRSSSDESEATDPDEAADENATRVTSNRSMKPSLESAAKNSD